MKIKRRKKPKRLSHYRQSIRWLKKNLKRAEAEAVTDDLRSDLVNDKLSINEKHETEELINYKEFLARVQVVKRFFADAEKFKQHVIKNYQRELNFSKDEWFPLKWMERDPKIMTVFDQYPMLKPILNYLFNYNRRLANEKRKKMIELTDSITDGMKYGDKEHDFATFITDAKFWEKASQKLGVSEILLKKYLTAFHKAGLIFRLGQVCTGKAGRKPYLIADGYYAPFKDKFRKISFIKDSKEVKAGLRNLPKFLGNN